MATAVNEWGDKAVETTNQWGDKPYTATANAGDEDPEIKYLMDNIRSADEEKKQRDAAKSNSLWSRFIETGAVLGSTPEVGGGPTEGLPISDVTAAEVSSVTGLSKEHAENLSGFLNSISTPAARFMASPEGFVTTATAGAGPIAATLIGGAFFLDALRKDKKMSQEAGEGWVQAHNPNATTEERQAGWEKFYAAIGNVGVGTMGAMPGARATSAKLGALPTQGLIDAAKPVLPNAAKEAEALPKEKGTTDAQRIREDTGQPEKAGPQPEGVQADRGGDVPKEAPKSREETPSQVEPSQPPPQAQQERPATEPETPPQKTAAEPSVTPAIQTPSGETFTGEDHVSAYAKAKETVPDTSGSKEGFVDNATGGFITREQAAEKTGLPTQTEEGKLHSSDLPETTSPISAGKEGETKTAQAELREADDFTGKAAMESEKATREWAIHVEDVVNPLRAKIRKIQSEVGEMEYDAKRTTKGTKVKNKLTKKAFFEKYGVTSMEEANALYKSKNAEWASIEKQLVEAEAKRKDLEFSKERRGKEWSRAATRAGELRRKVYPKVREGDVSSSTPVDEGPGAATPQGVGARAEIEQLADSFKAVKGEKVPLSEQVKKAFDVGKKYSQAKDAVSEAIEGVKSSGNFLVKKWEGAEGWDSILKIKGEHSAEVEANGYRLRQFQKAVKKAMPRVEEREGIAAWIDAGGDAATLQRGSIEAPDRYKESYRRALRLTPDQKTVAQNIQNYFESVLQEAIDAGVLKTGIEDYMHRIYEKDTPARQRLLDSVQSGALDTRSPSLARKRIFELDLDAEKAGLKVVKDFLPRIIDYEASLRRAIADRAAVKKFSELKMPDGRPMTAPKGVGIPVEDAQGVRESTIIKPSVPAPLRGKGKTRINIDDYKHRDYAALKKWKWVAEDSAGKPIMVQGDLAIHPDAVGRIDAMLKPSAIRQSKAGRFALGLSSTMKQTLLDFSGFHQVQIGIHGMEHLVGPWKGYQPIDINTPEMQGLLKGGLTLGGEYRISEMSEGLVGRSLSRQIPGIGPLMETYHEWLFQDYIPRIKSNMALHALERNRARFADDLKSGRMTEDELNYRTAKEANAAFGGLNYTMLERSKTARDISRLILLAPDFLEARGRFAVQAFERGGKGFFATANEQRQALLLGALTMWITARMMNKWLDGQYHFEPENAFSVVHNGHAYSMRTVQGDILHAVERPAQFAVSRVNPLTVRPVMEMASGRDYYGRKRGPMEQVWDFVSTAIPISMRSSPEQHLWESMMNAMGVTARRFTASDEAYRLADKWKEQHGITAPGEFIYDRDKDPLRKLKIALSENDEVGASKEIDAVIKSGRYTEEKLDAYFNRYKTHPFTGSIANDEKWEEELSDDQKKTVEIARQNRKAIADLYDWAKELRGKSK